MTDTEFGAAESEAGRYQAHQGPLQDIAADKARLAMKRVNSFLSVGLLVLLRDRIGE